jgi:hypothetical protein
MSFVPSVRLLRLRPQPGAQGWAHTREVCGRLGSFFVAGFNGMMAAFLIALEHPITGGDYIGLIRGL